MALADRPTAPLIRGPICRFHLLSQALPPEDRATLDAWMADPTVHGSVIARNLTDEGYTIREHTVNQHRAGRCACGTR